MAWLYSQEFLDGLFTARDLVAMATRTAAQILKWERALGSIEAGKRADLLVIDGTDGDPYELLVRARETSVRLVLINGVARYGRRELMDPLGTADQTVRVEGDVRQLFLAQEGRPGGGRRGPAGHGHERADRGAPRHPEARARAGAPARHPGAPARLPPDARESVVWTLALDETRDTGLELRPRLPYSGPRDFTGPEPLSRRAARAAASARLSDILKPIALDPLTVVDDGDFLDQVAAQPKVPQAVREGLRDFY